MADLVIDAGTAADIAKFEQQLERYLAGDLDDDVFRVFRLNNGIYGQRQGGHNQMVRIKAPGGVITAAQLDRMADIADTYSRGWGHLTTRQNMQFHYVQLERVPDVIRDLASVGLTTREACGDTVRNVQGCHLAGACPFEILDITPGPRPPSSTSCATPSPSDAPQVQDQLLGLRHRLRPGHVQRRGRDRRHPHPRRGTLEAGFRVYIAGGLGANHTRPSPSRSSPHARTSSPPSSRCCGSSTRPATATTSCGPASSGWSTPSASRSSSAGSSRSAASCRRRPPGPAASPPRSRRAATPPPASPPTAATPMGQGTPVALTRTGPYDRSEHANVVRGVAKGTVSAYA